MKRMLSVALASFMLARPALPAIVHGGGGGGGGGGHGSWGGGGGHAMPSSGGMSRTAPSGRMSRPSDAAHVRSVGVTRAGAAPSARAMNTNVVHNAAVTRSIAASQRTEIVPGHTWVHNDGFGHSFSHFCAFDHTHWFGFWFGASFVWFPYYYNYWWWYDPYYARWDYWYDGYWWYYGPSGVTYIYVNNAYVPYDQYVQTYDSAPPPEQDTTASSDQSATMPVPPSTPPKTPPASVEKYAPASTAGTWKTPDGRRSVQISGAASGAFLFDQTKNPPSLIKHLGDNAKSVRFSGGKAGPTKILVDYKDGSFHLYDENGHLAD